MFFFFLRLWVTLGCQYELRHQLSLALTNQQVRNIYCLTTFPLCPVIHIHTHVFVFSHGLLCSLSLSRWDLILNDYRRIRRRILDNGAVMQQTTLQLVDVSHTTLVQWHNKRVKRQDSAVVMQGLDLPSRLSVATDPLLPANVCPPSAPPPNQAQFTSTTCLPAPWARQR